MAVYQLTFTPHGPYFFGNEKTFAFVGESARYGKLYYIRGERLPSQSTIFGALRYLLLPEKTFASAARSAELIGPESFRLGAEGQSFGMIQAVSPLFLAKGEEWFVPTPFDHNTSTKSGVYTPLSDYVPMRTLAGEKLYAKDYDAKSGLPDSFMSLSDGHIEEGLFTSTVRVGIQRGKDLFKREFHCLKQGYSFSILAQLELKDLDGKNDVVYMGQGKTPFMVRFSKVASFDALKDRVQTILLKSRSALAATERPCQYCLSDALVEFPMGETAEGVLYQNVKFSVTQLRDHRAYQTTGSKIQKDGTLYRLVKAGSIFVGGDVSALMESPKQDNARTVGYNWVIKGE